MAVTEVENAPDRAPTRGWSTTDPDLQGRLTRFTEEALERHKHQGMLLAFRARVVAMVVIGVMTAFIAPWPAALYYEVLVVVFMLIGLAQRWVATAGVNRWELFLLFCDLALMTVICVVPNPLDDREMPLGFMYRFETFMYFFVILGVATLSYSWRTIIAVGTWTAGLWTVGLLGVWAFRDDPAPWRERMKAIYPDSEFMQWVMDPSALLIDIRIQEAIVFLIVAVTLAVSVRRSNQLLLSQAAAERERANLARYFSPNVVDQLSKNDEPLKQVVEQDVAVLFVDIVGFTAYAADRSPREVIETLREFHGLMEQEIFRHEGTLDKYLGDGLMATFGTPFCGDRDAANALRCARSMTEAVRRWNEHRREEGRPEIRASFGLHAGPVVLGDIGANRLEFAVIGNTVNVASRLEALSRPLGARLVASDAVVERVNSQGGTDELTGLVVRDEQKIRGIDGAVRVWTLE